MRNKNPKPPKALRPRRAARAPGLNKDHLARGERIVVGLHAVREALVVRPQAVSRLILRQGFHDSGSLRELAEMAERHSVAIEQQTPALLERFAQSHQGVAAFIAQAPSWDPQALSSLGPQSLVVLDEISDPQNLGSILRTAWLLDQKAIFIAEDRAAPLTPAAAKVASGGAEHVPVVRAQIVHQIETLKTHDFWCFGLSEKGARSIWDLILPQKIAWVIGSEEKGLRTTVARACDELVRIPQVASGSSYNAAMAAAIALAEGARQHRILK